MIFSYHLRHCKHQSQPNITDLIFRVTGVFMLHWVQVNSLLTIFSSCISLTWGVWLHLMLEVDDKFTGFTKRKHLHWEQTAGNLGCVVQSDSHLFVKLLCQPVMIKSNCHKISKTYHHSFSTVTLEMRQRNYFCSPKKPKNIFITYSKLSKSMCYCLLNMTAVMLKYTSLPKIEDPLCQHLSSA